MYDTIYFWDRAGRLYDLTLPSGRIVQYRRDSFGRISLVMLKENSSAAPVTLANAFVYRPYGPLLSLNHGTGLALQLTPSRDYRELTRKVGGGTVQFLTHAYDAAGNMITRSDSVTSARAETFSYDALDRLISATGAYGSLAYTLDANGNRTSRSIGELTETYAYGVGTNRLSSVALGSGTRSFSYLASGHTGD